jgi:hypothetical protein
LNFIICEDDLKNNNDYTEILAHLLRLKTLKKLRIHLGDLIFTPAVSKINVYNPAVESLTITIANPIETDLQKLPKFFPNVTNLEITWDYSSIDNNMSMNLRSINLMQTVRDFSINYMTEEMLIQLGLKQMQEFHLTSCRVNPFPSYFDTAFMNQGFVEPLPSEILESRSTSWSTFVNNNCQLKVLDVTGSSIQLELLQITLENLPLLKSLRISVDGCNYSSAQYQPEYTFGQFHEIYVKEQAEKTANLIGEHYDRFEKLELKLQGGELVVDHLRKNYPNVRIEKQTMRIYGEIQREKLMKVIILCHSSKNRNIFQ